MVQEIITFIRDIYGKEGIISLHEPFFHGNEKAYLNECIDSTFVSSVGKFVDQFEERVSRFTNSDFAVATVNGTSALHIALLLAGVEHGDEVITQPLTFVATCNALSYIGAHPVFIDVDRDTLSLSPEKLEHFLRHKTEQIKGVCVNKATKRRIKAIVPMHTFGLPARIEELVAIADRYHVDLIEDAAESLGSFYKAKHTGTFGRMGVLSFNGNKTITTGGGGMILTNDEDLARKAKHLTTTGKMPHRWDFVHDQVAYNYRLPNINAALGCAQMESLPVILKAKRRIAESYTRFFENRSQVYIAEPRDSQSNYWLNAIVVGDLHERNQFLEQTNDNGIMTRPIWRLMNRLPMFSGAQTENLDNALWLEERVVNLPSSAKND